MHHRSQFGMRENPASDRRHGSCPLASRAQNENSRMREILHSRQQSPSSYRADETGISFQGMLPQRATGREKLDPERLMTVSEVAELLQVPPSWVYAHTRHRSSSRIPGIRLGKYWRFERAEILKWIQQNCKKDYPRVG